MNARIADIIDHTVNARLADIIDHTVNARLADTRSAKSRPKILQSAVALYQLIGAVDGLFMLRGNS